MAYRALLVDEELATRRGIAGPIEVAQGVEEPDEIARLLARELGTRDTELLHALGHAREMVPEGRRHVVEGMRARALGEIGSDLASDAVDRVTLLATLGGEHARARHRILARAEHGLRPRAVEGHQRHRDRDSAHHDSDHWRPFLSGPRWLAHFCPTAADATRIPSRSQELLQLQLEHAGRIRVAHLRIVEHGHSEGVLLLGIGELDVVFAARGELAPEHAGAHAILVDDLGGDVAAIPRERGHDDAGHLVARLVLGVIEGLLLGVDDPVRRRRPVALQGELGSGLRIVYVVGVASARLRIAFPSRLWRLVLVVAGGVEVLIVDLADAPSAHELHVPDVGTLTRIGQVLVAEGLALARVTSGEAPLLIEGRRARS